jgi:ppGpp synthetase/RelA/SpoT-type nucleotidyltranferase
MPNIPIEKHKEDIKAFKSMQENYMLYAKVLKAVLEKVKEIYSPLGFVEARAKKAESFSEKIIRKDKYKNPLADMTDLCGARIIAHFSDQVHEICTFIEQNFEIDKENSLDLKSKLSTSEFGYRAIHYIVIPRKAKILDIEIPDEIRGLKAEIQVRTFHEHIWADILHDRIYKSSIKITEEWKRESARLAALLEKADSAFARISNTIDQLAINYQVTPAPEKLKNEIEVLKVLIQMNKEIDDKDAESRLKLGRIYNLTGEWKETIELLEPVMRSTGINESILAGVLREYGYAECIQNNTDKRSKKYLDGLIKMKEAVAILENNPAKKKELALLYKCMADVQENNAPEYIALSHKLSPENPYYFTRLLVEKIRNKDSALKFDLDLLSSKIEEVLFEFREHINLGIEVGDAYMNTGKLLFLQSKFQESIENYAKLMMIVLKDQLALSKEAIVRELKSFDKIAVHNPFNALNIKGLLHLMLWLKFGDKDSKKFLLQFRSKESYSTDEILIICGKSKELSENKEKIYGEFITEALRDFSGTVISGGTSSGIPGLVGTISASRNKNGIKKFRTVGYLPEVTKEDRDYDAYVRTKASEFSVLEVISYWVDILFSDVKREKVFVFGMNGGNTSVLEYKIALAIGAKVCLVGKLGGSAHDIIIDPEWNRVSNLYNIPDDPLTIWAMINHDKPGLLTSEEINKLAPVVHEFYREKRRKDLKPEKETDINKYRVVMKWDKLAPSLQNSNLKQVAFMEHIFNRGKLKFKKSSNPAKFIIPDNYKTIDDMARFEHARWNAERLLDGWKYGPKDVLNKVTPYLIPWDELDSETKTYDYDPIKNFPGLLMTIGYEIVEI